MTEIDHLVPVLEAFVKAGLSRSKGYLEIQRGRLSVARNGRRTFVRASELQRYINTLSAASSTAPSATAAAA